jgi:Fic family protein
MGRMKELYMEMLHANNGNVPEEATIADLQRMKDLQIFEWQEYERKQEKLRLQQVKLSNPREITKVAKSQDYWEAELKTGQNRRPKKS